MNFKMAGKLVFIMGMPRSGTTIVAEVLGQHSKVVALIEKAEHYPISPFVEEKLKEGKVVVQKMPQRCLRLVEHLRQFPNAKFILMTRNLMDIIRSYKAYPNPAALQVEGIYDPREIWCAYINSILPYLDHPRCLHVRLEDFILRKMETLKRIFNFLDLELEPQVVEFVKKYVKNEPLKDYPLTASSFQRFKVSKNG
ncbi:MAG: hypothetical protein DRN25_00865 [Thermoplasmata archaeon]|nr:MAG: hypothetical protein DRN25_00865 [Thermoplasmata archaeon]